VVLTYKQCIEKFNSDYGIKRAIRTGEIYQIERGIYSNQKHVSTLAILSTKYPDAIVTLDTAFYYHELTDVVPDKYYIATAESARKLRDTRIKQIFVKNAILDIGVTTMERGDAFFCIYDRERMLIELLRYKNKLPYDYYKEILGNYRNIINELDIERIQEYASIFPKSKMISEALDREVF